MTKLFQKFRYSIRKKSSDQHSGKIVNQEFRSWSTKYLKLKIKNKSWYIHDIFEPVSSTQVQLPLLMLLLLAILIFWYFDILTFSSITVVAIHKDVSSIRIFKLHTCVLFIIIPFLLPKAKTDLINKIFIENQLAIKTNQLTDS